MAVDAARRKLRWGVTLLIPVLDALSDEQALRMGHPKALKPGEQPTRHHF
jgi:hypothetical protein